MYSPTSRGWLAQIMCQAVVWRAHANLPFLSHPFGGVGSGGGPNPITWLPGNCSSAHLQLIFHENCSTYRCIFDVLVNRRWAPCPPPRPSWPLLFISFTRRAKLYWKEHGTVSNPISALPGASHFTWRPHVSLDPFTWFHSLFSRSSIYILKLHTECSQYTCMLSSGKSCNREIWFS